MNKIQKKTPPYNQEYLDNATFQYYKEFVENYIYSLYYNHDKRLDNMNLNQLESFTINLSEFLIHKENIFDFFELKNNSDSYKITANIKKDNFDKAFTLVLKDLSWS